MSALDPETSSKQKGSSGVENIDYIDSHVQREHQDETPVGEYSFLEPGSTKAM
jgi:hypothetical protein